MAERRLRQELSEPVLDRLREELTSSAEPITAARIAETVRSCGLALGSGTTQQLVRSLRDELVGLGPLQRFVDAPGITDVLVDPYRRLWTDGAEGLVDTGVRLRDETQVRGLARRLISASGGRLDEGNPCADGRLGDCRIHAVIPPVAVGGTMISVRVSRSSTASLEDLARQWDDSQAWLELIRGIVDARLNVLISGATGSGKTSLLAAMLARCTAEERVVIVEDTAELRPDHPHTVHLQGRQGNVEGAGRIDMGHLVRQTLRMRPDRLIVGECRGAELRDFLTAMNTGHQGAGGTVHANSPEAVPARLVAMGALAGLAPEAVALQASAAVDVVVHVARFGDRRMPVAASAVRHHDGRLTTVPVFHREASGAAQRGPGWREFAARAALGGESGAEPGPEPNPEPGRQSGVQPGVQPGAQPVVERAVR
ncbi:TadA family conjugal transfer-associated ATPase [Nesterenkonia aerolata]|uniref:TadA family conjugal transfer-associated ATPase n=1 Tax=Nesterenkonia aerolata TaxID=3074079 RepID=A0ABU2DS92_9MICC|nr:TadA family conjugal transfer-associated ATPase [Nesterenkonia sp. LY-0111]MDR8019245.1 TadA family conjugal transfer-associated ATPase [Nesterenkonia sp. LY-0111]